MPRSQLMNPAPDLGPNSFFKASASARAALPECGSVLSRGGLFNEELVVAGLN
jgi:hypothetical protein